MSIRELTSGLTLRSGWLAKPDQTTFETFLRPLKQLEWPILAVLSKDPRRKRRGFRRKVSVMLGESVPQTP